MLYAAFRGITGPTRHEQLFAERRAFNSTFGELGRNTGSFTGPVGLVSFLVPASVVCLVLGFLRPQRRWLFALGFALAMTGIVASFVRTALVAVVAGAALMALIMLLQQGKSRRRGVYAVGLVVVVLAGGYGAALLAGEVSPTAEDRAESLANPFSDDSVTTRFDTWERTFDKVAEEPLGTGLGTVGRATAKGRKAAFTDSSYLKILQEQGPLGALLFLGGFGGLLVAAGIRLARAGPAERTLGTAALAGVRRVPGADADGRVHRATGQAAGLDAARRGALGGEPADGGRGARVRVAQPAVDRGRARFDRRPP